MASDATFTPSRASIVSTLRAPIDTGVAIGRVPGFDWAGRVAHWALRIPLIALMLEYGLQKFPAAVVNPTGFGVPAVLYSASAFAEVLGALALVLGGAVATWQPRTRWIRFAGDAVTRVGGFAAFAAAAGVIVYFYWGSVTLGTLQVMMLGLGLYVLLRGNR